MDKEQCKEMIWKDFHNYQCSRKPWRDGYCKQHHPDTVEQRKAESMERWQAKNEIWREARRLENAAPDLLSICKQVKDYLDHPEQKSHRAWELIEMLNEVIAKAEGKQ